MKKVAQFFKVSFEEFLKDSKHLGLNEEEIKEIYEAIKLPKRATVGSAGYDFYAPFDLKLEEGKSYLVPTGIRCQIEPGYFLALFPRSGLGFKYRVQLDNTVGIIDSDYFFSTNEGHIMAKITCDAKKEVSNVVNKGNGFIQGIFLEYGITIDDDTTEIRDGGFGSTTK